MSVDEECQRPDPFARRTEPDVAKQLAQFGRHPEAFGDLEQLDRRDRQVGMVASPQ